MNPENLEHGKSETTRSRATGGRATGARSVIEGGGAAAAAGTAAASLKEEDREASRRRRTTGAAAIVRTTTGAGARYVMPFVCCKRTHRSATAARSRGPRIWRRARAAAGASTSATTRRTGARRRRTRTTATTTSGGGRSPRRARPSARRVGSVGGGFKLRSALLRPSLYCSVLNAGRGARAAPGRARPALMRCRGDGALVG